jgi:hypothetical protein
MKKLLETEQPLRASEANGTFIPAKSRRRQKECAQTSFPEPGMAAAAGQGSRPAPGPGEAGSQAAFPSPGGLAGGGQVAIPALGGDFGGRQGPFPAPGKAVARWQRAFPALLATGAPPESRAPGFPRHVAASKERRPGSGPKIGAVIAFAGENPRCGGRTSLAPAFRRHDRQPIRLGPRSEQIK